MKEAVGIQKISLKTGAWLRTFCHVFAIVASVILAAMMFLTVADVIGRYFFNSPIKGTWELVGLLLVGAGTWGLAYCQYKKGHIRVDILLVRFPRRVQSLINFISYLVGSIGFGLISWRAFILGMTYFDTNRVTDTLSLPYFPFTFALTFGAGLLALILIIDSVQSLIGVIRK